MSTLPAQVLTFRIQDRWYACDLLWVKEILRRPKVVSVRRAPPVVRGLVHLRGQILTVLDLWVRLGLGQSDGEGVENCVVLKNAAELRRLAVQPPDANLAGTDLVGLAADHIGDILPGPEALLPPPPETLSRLQQSCVVGLMPRPEGLVTLLRMGEVISPEAAHAVAT